MTRAEIVWFRGIVLVSCLIFTPNLFANSLAPRQNWRAKPQLVVASHNMVALNGLSKGKTCTWRPGASQAWISLQFTGNIRTPVLLTFSASQPIKTLVEFSLNSLNGKDGIWKGIDTAVSGPFLNKVDLYPSGQSWVRIRFLGEEGNLKIWNLGLYSPKASERNDYWLALGASIQNQSMRQARFNPQVKKVNPSADPILFNLAVRGWSSSDLLGNLPGLLEQHPYASYALIHIGGNDVSGSRPFPQGAEPLQKNLEAILAILDSAGITPVLARLSYRVYRGDFPVPPETNGSGPYNAFVYDPLCNLKTPLFFNRNTGRCWVDFYSWFEQHPQELSSDGIHLNIKGEESWVKHWSKMVLSNIYDNPIETYQVTHQANFLRITVRKSIRFGELKATDKMNWGLQIRNLSGKLIYGSFFLGFGPYKEPTWDLQDNHGLPVLGGLYLYEFKQGSKSIKGKLLVAIH